MTKDEEQQALREENRALKALVGELLPLKGQLAQATARIKDLEERLASRTSSYYWSAICWNAGRLGESV